MHGPRISDSQSWISFVLRELLQCCCFPLFFRLSTKAWGHWHRRTIVLQFWLRGWWLVKMEGFPPRHGGTSPALGLGLAQFAFRTPSFGPCLPSWLWRSGEVWNGFGLDGWMDGWKVEKTRGVSWFICEVGHLSRSSSVLLQQVGWFMVFFGAGPEKTHWKKMDALSGTTRKAWLLKITESKQ